MRDGVWINIGLASTVQFSLYCPQGCTSNCTTRATQRPQKPHVHCLLIAFGHLINFKFVRERVSTDTLCGNLALLASLFHFITFFKNVGPLVKFCFNYFKLNSVKCYSCLNFTCTLTSHYFSAHDNVQKFICIISGIFKRSYSE